MTSNRESLLDKIRGLLAKTTSSLTCGYIWSLSVNTLTPPASAIIWPTNVPVAVTDL